MPDQQKMIGDVHSEGYDRVLVASKRSEINRTLLHSLRLILEGKTPAEWGEEDVEAVRLCVRYAEEEARRG